MMINEAHISLSGYVATQPALKWTRTGVPALNMRVAWTPRRMDRVTGEWIDMSTNFLTVYAYRKLAENAATCLRKGDPVVLRGRVSTRDFEDKNGHQRTALEVDAISFGHDMTRGVSTFQRVRPQTGMTANEYQESANGAGANGAGAFGAGPDGAAGRDGDPAELAGVGSEAGVGAGPDATGPDATGPDGAASDPSRELFDEDAVSELAREPEPEPVAVPF
ncbi:MAG TPA: single-stranded DNA-binding protein [Streptosporangiaceae bacterium]